MTDAAPSTALTVRENIRTARELAAATLPMVVEKLAMRVMESEDVEVLGKGADRLAKIAGMFDDKGTSSLPTINVTFSGTAFHIPSVTPPKQPLEMVEDVTPLPTVEVAAWADGLFSE